MGPGTTRDEVNAALNPEAAAAAAAAGEDAVAGAAAPAAPVEEVKDTEPPVKTYDDYLKELEAKRFLTIQQQGQGRVNIYHLDLQSKQPKVHPSSKGRRKNFPVKSGSRFRSGAEIFSD